MNYDWQQEVRSGESEVLWPSEWSCIYVRSRVAGSSAQCTEVRFASFLSGEIITAIVVNPPERKLAKSTSVQWCGTCLNLCALAEQSLRTLMKVSSACAKLKLRV